MTQIQTSSGQEGGPVGQITIGRLEQASPFKLVIHVLPNVSFQAGLKLLIGQENQPSELSAAFGWCTNTRCMAQRDLSPEEVLQLRRNTNPGKIQFTDADAQSVTIPVSFKAFGAALDKMLAESSQNRTAESANTRAKK